MRNEPLTPPHVTQAELARPKELAATLAEQSKQHNLARLNIDLTELIASNLQEMKNINSNRKQQSNI